MKQNTQLLLYCSKIDAQASKTWSLSCATSEGEATWLLACQTVVHSSLTKGFSAFKTLEIVAIDVWVSDIYSSYCSF